METLSDTVCLTNERCTNELIDGPCRRMLHEVEGEKVCFYCQDILNNDLEIAQKTKQAHINKPFNQLMKNFESKSLMNADLKPCTINGYKPKTELQQRAKQVAAEYVKGFDGKSGIVFYGNPGSGKSHLLSGIVKGVMSVHGKSALFISLPRLLSELKGTFGKSDQNEMDILSALYQVDLLIIDEIGGERKDADDAGTPWVKKKLNEIVDARAGKATCYSSNYNFEQLLDMYGERDFSRIVQYAEVYEVDGPNGRMERFKK